MASKSGGAVLLAIVALAASAWPTAATPTPDRRPLRRRRQRRRCTCDGSSSCRGRRARPRFPGPTVSRSRRSSASSAKGRVTTTPSRRCRRRSSRATAGRSMSTASTSRRPARRWRGRGAERPRGRRRVRQRDAGRHAMARDDADGNHLRRRRAERLTAGQLIAASCSAVAHRPAVTPRSRAADDRRRTGSTGGSRPAEGHMAPSGGMLPECPRRPASGSVHVDLDQFLAAVEVLRRPELAGRPVVVGGDGDPTARPGRGDGLLRGAAFGVRSGMPLRTAARRCPDCGLPCPATATPTTRRRPRSWRRCGRSRRGRGGGVGRGVRRRHHRRPRGARPRHQGPGARPDPAELRGGHRRDPPAGQDGHRLRQAGGRRPPEAGRLAAHHGRPAGHRHLGIGERTARRLAEAGIPPCTTSPWSDHDDLGGGSVPASVRRCGCSASAVTTPRWSTSPGCPARAARRRPTARPHRSDRGPRRGGSPRAR